MPDQPNLELVRAQKLGFVRRIDRIDSRGNICEHIMREHSDHPLCGVDLNQTQPAAGNRPCKNCLTVQARRQHDATLREVL